VPLTQEPGLRRVLITSGGGATRAALAFATRVYDLGLDVEVTGACFSSCADSIFAVVPRKIIGPKGLVAWHGNAEFGS